MEAENNKAGRATRQETYESAYQKGQNPGVNGFVLVSRRPSEREPFWPRLSKAKAVGKTKTVHPCVAWGQQPVAKVAF